MSLPFYRPPFVCEKLNCETCKDSYLSGFQQKNQRQAYIKHIPDNQAEGIIRDHADSIERDYLFLKEQIDQRGDAILKAWSGANPARKAKALQAATAKIGSLSSRWEGLRMHHAVSNEEVNAKGMRRLTIDKSPTLRQRRSFRNALLLPYLSKGALTEDETLFLCLLHNRTEFPPSKWSNLDLQLTSFGRKNGLLERNFSTTFFLTKDGVYGLPAPYSRDHFHTDGTLLGFPNCEVLFEAQRKLYGLLRAVVTDLLKDRKVVDTGKRQWLNDASQIFLHEPKLFPRNLAGSGAAADRLVCSPPVSIKSFIECCKTSAKTRQSDAERDLLSLQTDPEHMQRRLAHPSGSAYYRGLGSNAWNHLALDVWSPVFRRAWTWDFVALWAVVLEEKPHLEILGVLYFIIEKTVQDVYGTMITDLLVKGEEFSTQLRQIHGKSKSQLTVAQKLEAAQKVTPIHLAKDPLFWAMANLAKYEMPGLQYDPPQRLPLDELVVVAADAITRKSEKEREALRDANVLATIDDLAALSCILSMLDSLPLFHKFELPDVYNAAAKKYVLLIRRPPDGGCYAASNGMVDVFDNDSFLNRLGSAGSLLSAFSKLPLPQWNKANHLGEWEQVATLRTQLDKFWEELSKKRTACLAELNSGFAAEIDILPDVTVMQQGYEDSTDLWLIARNIAAQQMAQASKPAVQQGNRMAETPAGQNPSYVPLPNVTTSPRHRANQIQLSKRQERIKERADREEAARVAAGAEPTPVVPKRDPPLPIRVDQNALNTIAWFWPYASQVYGTRRTRVTWTKCMAALVQAGLNLVNVVGNHHTFRGRDGTLTYPAPHGRRDSPMDSLQLIWLGRQCERELGWTWSTFDPNFDLDGAVAELGDEDNGDGGGGVDAGDWDVGDVGDWEVGGDDGDDNFEDDGEDVVMREWDDEVE